MPGSDAVSAFLHFGYLPEMHPHFVDEIVRLRDAGRLERADTGDRSALVRRGAQALRAGFRDPGPGPHVVPLSGGLDSRVILSCLCERGVGAQVTTVTFGLPGTFDYEIARVVAHRAGVAHEAIDLRGVPLTMAALEATLADSGACSWGFDALCHRLIPDRFGPRATYWSGYMAGALAGSRLPAAASRSWPEAVTSFVATNRFSNALALAEPDRELAAGFTAVPFVNAGALSYDDQLDFGVRQAGYIRSTLLPQGVDLRTPFLDPAWVGFMLGLPSESRRDARLYRRILAAGLGELFRLPTKNTFGLPLGTPGWVVSARRRSAKLAAALRERRLRQAARRPLPQPRRMANYMDFGRDLREREDLRTLVHDGVHALDRRGAVPWLRPREMWRHHLRFPADAELATALSLLAALEANLRVESRRPAPRLSG